MAAENGCREKWEPRKDTPGRGRAKAARVRKERRNEPQVFHDRLREGEIRPQPQTGESGEVFNITKNV